MVTYLGVAYVNDGHIATSNRIWAFLSISLSETLHLRTPEVGMVQTLQIVSHTVWDFHTGFVIRKIGSTGRGGVLRGEVTASNLGIVCFLEQTLRRSTVVDKSGRATDAHVVRMATRHRKVVGNGMTRIAPDTLDNADSTI
ncbi:hypothetical protein GCM10009765_48190 [Fodinicola feengrottensis]|uniref:Uncharacterized protein n=1 Tax=Fodinicola feengrottensis TaxID=435914 RepID=A0ABN2HU13_9ACTN|nr:hypothetical protein [Fodinicola feengrottensis]